MDNSTLHEYLPEKVAELAGVIGLDPALKLAAAWPGIRLFVPKEIAADNPIAVAIGVKSARELAAVYGGDSIVLPICQRYHRAVMWARINEERRAGASAAELARKYGVHQFSVYRQAARDEEAKQGSLL